MRCWRARRQLVEFEDRGYPAGLRRHTEECAACRKLCEEMAFTRRLIGLKRYEQPDPGLEGRCARRIHMALAAGAGEEERSAAPVAGWGPLPAFRFATAAALVLLLGGLAVRQRLGSLNSMLAGEAPEENLPRHVAVEPTPVAAPDGAEQNLPLLVPGGLALATNRGTGGVQYGPVPSQPVRFDY